MKIAISGKMGCGKTTLTKGILANDEKWRVVSLATPMKLISTHSKDIISEKDSLSLHHLTTLIDNLIYNQDYRKHILNQVVEAIEEFKEEIINNEKPRGFLQFIGTEIFRKYDPNVWINYLINNCADIDNVICDDMRFINEADTFKYNGWKLVRCELNEAKRMSRIKRDYGYIDEAQLIHRSEIDLDNYYGSWDYVMDMSYPMDMTSQAIDIMMAALRREE